MNLLRYIVLGTMLEGLAIIGFISVAKTAWAYPGKQMVVALFMISVIGILSAAMKALPLKGLATLSIALAMSFAIIVQSSGFAYFPGLVKDLSLFSPRHFQIMLIFFGILSAGLLLVSVAILIKKRKNNFKIKRTRFSQ